jgi:hypothetical protein
MKFSLAHELSYCTCEQTKGISNFGAQQRNKTWLWRLELEVWLHLVL